MSTASRSYTPVTIVSLRKSTNTAGTVHVSIPDLLANTTPTQEIYALSQPVSTQTLPSTITFYDLGWTLEKAIEVRGIFAAFAEDWDDPEMDVYNVYLDT